MKIPYPTLFFFKSNLHPLPGLLAFFLFYSLPGNVLNAQPEKSLFDYLNEGEEVIDLVLKTDMDSLINYRRREEYQAAELLFTDKKKVKSQWEVGVVPRGNYRRRICAFPPIRLNFSKSQLEEQGLNPEYDKLKVVAPCLKEEEGGEGYLLKEYLVYKIYNQLTPNSYRVQLARISFHDTGGKYDKIKHYCILIEETDELANRLGGIEFEGLNQPAENFATAEENIMSVFQHMIGNEDWDLVMLRNLKLVRPDSGGLIPVPYDFDFSGFVNAPYAVPDVQRGLTSVRQRIFMGHPVEKEQLQKTLSHFGVYRSHIRSIIKNFKLLGFSERMNAIDYIESFYENESVLIRENNQKRREWEEKNAVTDPPGQ